MVDIDFAGIEAKWQSFWHKEGTFRAQEGTGKPKYYVLTMFPYPSGKGLHVGHPLSYVAADIVARYHRHRGFEVLHPMGFDAFGLPAEQYAIQTGKHPAQTTAENIATYKKQLEILGLSYDWEREVRTCDPNYYKWTQWIFLRLFHAYFDHQAQAARPISQLVERFERQGSAGFSVPHPFTAPEWKGMDASEKEMVLQHFRLAYLAWSEVNWCEALGTVLANDEVINGLSERGGHPVTKKRMRQWYLRISAYAERLLQGLEGLEWPEPLKDMQRNWIGKSVGAELSFPLLLHDGTISQESITVFTTRPDTVFGASFVVVAPESDWVARCTTPSRASEVEAYLAYVRSRSERERLSEVKRVTGAFTGSYVRHPFTGQSIPVYTSEYVVGSYGTGAIMAVPGHDARDHAFAQKFVLPIVRVVRDSGETALPYEGKAGVMVHSEMLDGLEVDAAIEKAINDIEGRGLGRKRVNFRMRDAGFSRQRYWGEPIPIVFEGNRPIALPETELPLDLPEVDSFKPTGTGKSPLAKAGQWLVAGNGLERETDTMPGYAGSSWYWLRYMDPHNNRAFALREKVDYWQQVDLYIGGAEHAVGHLLYSRLWQKVLFDLGLVGCDEPFKKMVNQGMIQGASKLVGRVVDTQTQAVTYVSAGLRGQFAITDYLHVDVALVNANDEVDLDAFTKEREEGEVASFALEGGKLICHTEIEKMSKRWLNVVTPDAMVSQYGADTFRMYEMFLGPITDSKPWNTHGIEGVYKFLRKFWNLFFNRQGQFEVSIEPAPRQAHKALHTCIQRVNADIAKLSLNTCVSHFMICVNELHSMGANHREVLEPLVVLLSPFAPHLTEELWESLGHAPSVSQVAYPVFDQQYLEEAYMEYPVMINGKLRAKVRLATGMGKDEALQVVMADEGVRKWLGQGSLKNAIFVPGRIINLVVA